MDKGQSDEKPKPGDLIEIFRGLYEHWAVYIGDGLVVHIAPPSEVAGAGANCVMSIAAQSAMVKKEKLRDVVGTDKWKVNKDLDEKYEPHPTDTIVKEALELVGTEQPYDIMTQNCEHFAKELRYGKAESWQVRRAAIVAAGTVGLVGFVVFMWRWIKSLFCDREEEKRNRQ